jgi:Fe2+ transport system protein B
LAPRQHVRAHRRCAQDRRVSVSRYNTRKDSVRVSLALTSVVLHQFTYFVVIFRVCGGMYSFSFRFAASTCYSS